MTEFWTEQDAEHLRHLAECADPQWIGEVASRAETAINRLRAQRDEARKTRNDLIAAFARRGSALSGASSDGRERET
jgi:hypothetical protein